MDQLDNLIWSNASKVDKPKEISNAPSLKSLAQTRSASPASSMFIPQKAPQYAFTSTSSSYNSKISVASSAPSSSTSPGPANAFLKHDSKSNSIQNSRSSTPTPPVTNDSFSNLVSFESSKRTQGLSLIEQAKLKAQQVKEKQVEVKVNDHYASEAFWDSLTGSESVLVPQRSQTPISKSDIAVDSFDVLSDRSKETQDTGADDPFDLTSLQQKRQITQEKNAIHVNGDNEDDFLGDLAKPVEHFKSPEPPSLMSQRDRSRSPTPAINQTTQKGFLDTQEQRVTRIVEMGFSSTQAAVALAASDDNVEKAVELLIQTGSKPSILGKNEERQGRRVYRDQDLSTKMTKNGRNGSATSSFFNGYDDLQATPNRRSTSASRRRGTSSSRSRGDETTQQFQEQAERVLVQGKEIGKTMLKSAGDFLKYSKKSINKAIGDLQRGEAPISNSGPRRPKWMRDSLLNEDESPTQNAFEAQGFRDDFENIQQASSFTESLQSRRPPESELQHEEITRKPTPKSNEHLFENAYVSPARRKVKSSSVTATSTSSGRAISPSPSMSIQQKPSVPPSSSKPVRKIVDALPAQMITAEGLKVKGNDAFKLGQYGEAIEKYSQAIQQLPNGHLHLVVLHNNRAVARLKNGEQRATVEDCCTVIDIIGNDYTTPLPADFAHMKLKDQLVKALLKRAEALEALEKYLDAKRDYEKVYDIDGPSRNVSEGIRRCDKVLNSAKLQAVSKPKLSKPRSSALDDLTSNINQDSSIGVVKLREAAAAQAKEEDERFQLQEKVNSQLLAWKSGKERNLRALLSSLNVVLWPELGWQSVGLNQLIQPNQVKIRYIKGIAKLHPDKLSSMTLTTEQKMMADGIFASLNQAWDAFKEDNNL